MASEARAAEALLHHPVFKFGGAVFEAAAYGRSRRSLYLVDGGDLPLAGRRPGVAQAISLKRAHRANRHPARLTRWQQHLKMSWRRQHPVFLLRWIEADERHRD